ncbi:MAG: hypothetical protein ACKO34_06435 [Vampirovibrionales bacterium]
MVHNITQLHHCLNNLAVKVQQVEPTAFYEAVVAFSNEFNTLAKHDRLPVECCLEDAWPEADSPCSTTLSPTYWHTPEALPAEGHTFIETFLRGTRSKVWSPPLARDCYTSWQDAKGVRHLGDYVGTVVWLTPETLSQWYPLLDTF